MNSPRIYHLQIAATGADFKGKYDVICDDPVLKISWLMEFNDFVKALILFVDLLSNFPVPNTNYLV